MRFDRAEWSPEGFTCDPALLARAQVVVGMGEVFGTEDGAPTATRVPASLDGPPLAVMLTVLRASSRVLRAAGEWRRPGASVPSGG